MAAAATAQKAEEPAKKSAEEAAKILDAAHASVAKLLCGQANALCVHVLPAITAYDKQQLGSKPRKS